jgi:hypothetical protein
MVWLTAIPDFIKGVFGFGTKALDVYMAKANGNVQMAIALMAADQARVAAQRDILIAGMSHPIWWLGWFFFVGPLGVYWSKVIVYDKVLGLGSTDPLTGFILEWAGWIVASIFCLQVGTGIVASVLNRLTGGKS